MTDDRSMLVDVHPVEAIGNLVEYFHRLGCRVERHGASRLWVSVAFPDTVEDEAMSLREWCESWSGSARIATLVEQLESG